MLSHANISFQYPAVPELVHRVKDGEKGEAYWPYSRIFSHAAGWTGLQNTAIYVRLDGHPGAPGRSRTASGSFGEIQAPSILPGCITTIFVVPR